MLHPSPKLHITRKRPNHGPLQRRLPLSRRLPHRRLHPPTTRIHLATPPRIATIDVTTATTAADLAPTLVTAATPATVDTTTDAAMIAIALHPDHLIVTTNHHPNTATIAADPDATNKRINGTDPTLETSLTNNTRVSLNPWIPAPRTFPRLHLHRRTPATTPTALLDLRATTHATDPNRRIAPTTTHTNVDHKVDIATPPLIAATPRHRQTGYTTSKRSKPSSRWLHLHTNGATTPTATSCIPSATTTLKWKALLPHKI